MTGKPKSHGWKVNISVSALNDPVLLNLSAEAFGAMIWLQLWSANAETDGEVPASAWKPAPPMYGGLPHITDAALSELEAAGLVRHRTEERLTVTWDGQTNRGEQREEWRVTKAEERARKKAEITSEGPMSEDVQKT